MSVEQFVALARNYIALVDECASGSPHDFLAACARLLPQIYAVGIELTDPELPEHDVELPPEQVRSPISMIGKLLGRYDQYAEVFDPVFDRGFLLTHLSDDLSDIYNDLLVPLRWWDRCDDAARSQALWQWKFNITGHCGDHLVDALRPIHRLVFDHMVPDYRSSDAG
jgi:hypothetical protein